MTKAQAKWVVRGEMMLLDIVLPGLVVVGLGMLIKAPDGPYFAGLAAAVIAYILSLLAITILSLCVSPVPLWAGLVLAPAVIEELNRALWGAREREGLATPRDWLFFGIGYGLYEGVGKLLDWGGGLASHDAAFSDLSAVFLSFALLVFLGVLAGALLRANWPWWAVFPVTFCVHALHNWLALEQSPYLGTWVVAWGGSYCVLIGAFLKLGARIPPMTSARANANTL